MDVPTSGDAPEPQVEPTIEEAAQRETDERRRAAQAHRAPLTPEARERYQERWAEVKAKLAAKAAAADPYSHLWMGPRGSRARVS